MAASYSTGTATGPSDLLQKIVTWLVAQGWTQDSSASSGSGWRAHLHKGGQYANLRALEAEAANISTAWGSTACNVATTGYGIGLYLGDGYNGANAFNNQSGGPKFTDATTTVGASMQLRSGAIAAYYLFDDGNDHITIVVNRGDGVFVHMGWGPSLSKVGYTNDHWYFYGSTPHQLTVANGGAGGPWMGQDATAAAPMAVKLDASATRYSCAFVRTDTGVYSARWVGISTGSLNAINGYTGREGRCMVDHVVSLSNGTEYPRLSTQVAPMLTRAYQSAFVGALLWPLHVYVASAAARWIPVGYPPTVFSFGGFNHGFSAGQVFALGGLNYMAFPNFAVRKAA